MSTTSTPPPPPTGAQIAIAIQNKTGKLLKNYLPALETSEEVKALKEEVEAFASTFAMPGYENH
jgi:glycine hydroxymethyltransferase